MYIFYLGITLVCAGNTDSVVGSDEQRAARDKDGKTVMVDGDLNYEEWYNKYVDNSPIMRLNSIKKENGIRGDVNLYKRKINLSEYAFDDGHINKDRKHNVNKEDAIRFYKQSKFSLTRWKGRFVNFYSEEGAVFVDVKNKEIKTAFFKEEYDENAKKMMGVFSND